MDTVYLGLGSNIGERIRFLRKAVDLLRATHGVRVKACSPVYETSPVGGPEQPSYLNAVVRIETRLWPGELLTKIHEIEARLKRKRRIRWGPRTVDIDILLWEKRIIQSASLTVPHPRMSERLFVLRPLLDLAPDIVHPKSNSSLLRLWQARSFEDQKCRRVPEKLCISHIV